MGSSTAYVVPLLLLYSKRDRRKRGPRKLS